MQAVVESFSPPAPPAAAAGALPEEPPRRSYEGLLKKLSAHSVTKHYDAYADIDWDAPANAIRADDPRFELSDDDVLGATAWYKAQPQAVRAELGLTGVVGAMKMGVVFESVLKRGLLEFAARLPNGSPEFRYAYHEVIEEAQHSLMFQEFINRSGLDPRGLSASTELGTRFVVRLGRVFPELFFFFVLGGEEPIDYEQKQALRSEKEHHPLLTRIMKIHVTEESRHLCFARSYLERNVPKLGFFARLRLAVMVPIILGDMAKMMLEPSRSTIRKFAIPASVIREAYTDNPGHKQKVRASLASVARLCIKLELLGPRSAWLWKMLGLGNPLKYA
ncbi:MAG: diiron oxygenase [Myxococcales bacterium]|nr:diiron oxygenase [Myxococcales bacterium]